MATLSVTSTAFKGGEMIPQRYTCDGENVSPELSWDNVPEKAESLAVICDDPDSASGAFAHWVLYNLPRGTTALQEGVPTDEELQDGTRQGVNSAQKTGFTGPCPPHGDTHRYIFHVYALDSRMNPVKGMTRAQLLMMMDQHILAQGELMGKYQRK